MIRFPLLVAAAATAITLASAAFAGEQYVDPTGYAVSGYDVVAYFDLTQAPVGTVQPAAVPGDKDITTIYNGATFAFSSEENKARFEAMPGAFVPQYDGHCAYGVAKGGKVPGNPNLWRIIDGKLYLNITQTVVGFWEEDIPGNLTLTGDGRAMAYRAGAEIISPEMLKRHVGPKNFSRFGLHIRSDIGVKVGDSITLALPYMDDKRIGRVVWRGGGGFGVKLGGNPDIGVSASRLYQRISSRVVRLFRTGA